MISNTDLECFKDSWGGLMLFISLYSSLLLLSKDVPLLCNIYCFVTDIKSSDTKHTDLVYRRKCVSIYIYVNWFLVSSCNYLPNSGFPNSSQFNIWLKKDGWHYIQVVGCFLYFSANSPLIFRKFSSNPILERGSAVLLLLLLPLHHAQGTPLDSETGWTGELWSKTNLLNWQN